MSLGNKPETIRRRLPEDKLLNSEKIIIATGIKITTTVGVMHRSILHSSSFLLNISIFAPGKDLKATLLLSSLPFTPFKIELPTNNVDLFIDLIGFGV